MVVGEFTQEAEVVIIGGGPGGYTAAFRAAELGTSVVIVDPRPSLGGICLHEGCIPSKTLLHVAEVIGEARRAEAFGVTFGEPTIDLAGVRGWCERTVGSLAKGLDGLCRTHGVERVTGQATFESSRSLAVRGGSVPRIRFRRAVIATGTRPLALPQLPFDDTRVVTPEQSLRLPDIPPRLLVVGSTYMAVEIGSIYAALGSEVTMVGPAGAVADGDVDPDLLRPLERSLKRRFAALHLGTTIKEARVDDDGISVRLEGLPDEPPGFDRAIVAVGRAPATAGLDLDRTSAVVDTAGFILVDAQQRTRDGRIFAVGDVTGPPLLADKAIAQGRVAAEAMAGWGSAYEPRAVPYAVFTDPQVAWCGLTEMQAKAADIPHRVARTPWGASGRAVAMNRAEGVTKVIYDPDTELVLGVGLAGAHAAEMIAEGALAIEMGAVLTDLAATVHPHPTMSELLGETSHRAENDATAERRDAEETG